MKRQSRRAWAVVALLIVAVCAVALSCGSQSGGTVDVSSQPTSSPVAPAVPTLLPTLTLTAPSPSPTAPPMPAALLPEAVAAAVDQVSQESLLAYIQDLTAIQPHSGWRNSASQGEAEALDYVAATLKALDHLRMFGLELERQTFRVPLGTELWETRLHLIQGGQEVEVPADGLRGPTEGITQALRFDSDGTANDTVRNPVVVEGPVRLVQSEEEIDALGQGDLVGKVVFVDYGLIDGVTHRGRIGPEQLATELLDRRPAGLVLVTSYSDELLKSHGTFAGDESVLNAVQTEAAPPMLLVRLEDLEAAGIDGWAGLSQLDSARLVWDADVFSPALSGNLAAYIPGSDRSRAVILAAHIDSPNSPGAMDDGSGSAVLLEVARILDLTEMVPPIDLYLVWFGSEELGLYGSAHFAATHQEVLDRTVAMLQVDCLTRPLAGIRASLALSTAGSWLGKSQLPWLDWLAEATGRHGVQVSKQGSVYGSDNLVFDPFDVPNAELGYWDEEAMRGTGSPHYAGHIHDPYETVDVAREMGDVLEEMGRVAVTAALEPPLDLSDVRVTPKPDARAVLVSSHAEPAQMMATTFHDLGMALALEGFDMDLVPYGQPVTAADLKDADLVFALPVIDLPLPGDGAAAYDEAWSPEEVAVLESYVAEGGLLVLTNSAYRLSYAYVLPDPNEDSDDANALAERFGLAYRDGSLNVAGAKTEGQSPLVERVKQLSPAPGNGVPFRLEEETDAELLAAVDGQPVVALVRHGLGEVLVLADVGILGGQAGPDNVRFWVNLARYARR